jgi:hypothetical protein
MIKKTVKQLKLIMKFLDNTYRFMCCQKQIITILFFCLTLVTFSSCMKRKIAGDYSATVYLYPKAGHTTIKEEVEKTKTDSNGVSHTVNYTLYKHVPSDRIETGIRFFFHIDSKLNISASYSKVPNTPITYFGKGKLREDSLIVDFFYRETRVIGGNVFDTIIYEPPLQLRFYVEKNIKEYRLIYLVSEQKVDSLDEYWSSNYSFKIQKELKGQ